MNKLGGGGLIGIAIVMVLLGLVLQLEIIDFMGGLIMIAGIVVALLGLVKVFTGRSEA